MGNTKAAENYEAMKPSSPELLATTYYNIEYTYQLIMKDKKNAKTYYRKALAQFKKAKNNKMVKEL
ncbi:MAG: hypothetical protein JW969_17130 [Spirochaetales bacterium]|nr:hypothetical protein [Spirochaetales bacterium]